MLRPSAAARPAATLLAGLLALLPVAAALADDPSPDATLARAEALVGGDRAREAVPILEDLLLAADAAARPKVVEALKAAYAQAADEATAAGDARTAGDYRANLAILQAAPGSPVAAGPAPEAPAPPAASAEPPAPLPPPEESPDARPAAPAAPPDRTAPAAEPGRLDLPDAADAEPAAQPAPTAGPDPRAEPEPDPAREALARADKAFRAKQYLDAGAIYADLARQRRLPEGYRDAWAYCRRFAVVQRINAGPRDSDAWAAIAAEIGQIRKLTPNHWYDSYLADLVRERSAGAPKGDGRKVVLRGASPDERTPAPAPAPSAPRPRSRAPAPAPAAAAEPAPSGPEAPPSAGAIADPFDAVPGVAPEASPAEPPADATEPAQPEPTAGAPEPSVSTEPAPPPEPAPAPAAQPSPFRGPDLANWQVLDSANFRIYHADPALAKKVSEVAEAAREAQTRRWTGAAPRTRWTPVCEIYLYPNARIFSQRTGQPEDSPGFSTSGLMAGRVTARRINLRADHPKLLRAILPHEVTHIVLAELFPVRQIPRWADEGMAVLSEPADEQAVRDADLDGPVHGGKIFSVEQILTMTDYPDGRHWPLYYAQSISITRYLVEQSSPARFAQFVRDAQEVGFEAALQSHYRIQGFSDLQARWLAYARQPRDGAVRTASAPTAANRD
jgi:hypothetical protein